MYNCRLQKDDIILSECRNLLKSVSNVQYCSVILTRSVSVICPLTCRQLSTYYNLHRRLITSLLGDDGNIYAVFIYQVSANNEQETL